MNIIHGIPPHFDKDCFVSIDSEWYGLNPKQLHRPTSGKFACATICPNDEDVYILTDPELLKPALDNMNECVWATQNGKFDIVQLRRHVEIKPRKKWWDTLYIEKIMYGGYYDLFGLEDLARRHLNFELDKAGQKYFEKATELNEDVIHYACMDALITRKVAVEQRRTIDKKSFDVWTNIDRPFTWAVMDFRGFPINPDKIKALAETNKRLAEELSANLPFNPKSPKQVLDWAHQNKAKIDATDEDTLREYIEKHPESELSKVFSAVLQVRSYNKLSSTYGMNLIEDYMEYEDGYPVIYPNINPNQSETGRTSSSDPNIQNQPKEVSFRECYESAPGHKLIISDYSAQEPRITAYVSQDPKLINIFVGGKDVYIEIYREMFGEEITKKDKRRKPMKDVFLGMTYGLTKWGFSKKQGISVEEADMLLTKSMNTFKGVQRWQDNQKKKKNFVETVSGRRIWINPYSYQADNNKLNAPIQGTAADMIKKSIAVMYETWPFDPYPFNIVAPIHDETVAHVPLEIAQDELLFIKNTMEQVAEEMCPGIPFIADAYIANNWGEKL